MVPQTHHASRCLTSELLPLNRHNLRSLPKCVQPSWRAVPRNPFYIDRSFLASITGGRSGAISAISKPADSDGVHLLVSMSPKNKGMRSMGYSGPPDLEVLLDSNAALLQI